MDYQTKNYTEQGGDVTHIGGVLEFGADAVLENFPGAANLAPKSTTTAADIRADLNALILALKTAGIMVGDAWSASVLACPTPAAMPTTETKNNSGHATLAISDNVITITLDKKVSELEDANHGAPWGVHKWLGFGVRTGLASVAGIKFLDDTGMGATLGDADATEATALGLSAGDFVLYIKADDEKYLRGEKFFTLWVAGKAKTKFTMKIVEPAPEA